MNNALLRDCSSLDYIKPWNKLFSSLKLAEKAAGDHAAEISLWYKKKNNLKLANFYSEMAEEEYQHADLVSELIDREYVPPQTSIDVYLGKKCRMKGDLNYIERSAIIHFVFEPSALAYMSYIAQNAAGIFEEQKASHVKKNLLRIVTEESLHVKQGRIIIEKHMNKLTQSEKKQLSLSIELHRKFIAFGSTPFFKEHLEQSKFSSDLNDRYAFSFKQANKGIFK